MSRVHQIDLRCEIDPQSASIHGEMSIRQGQSMSFNGWTEFAGALVSLTSRELDEVRPEFPVHARDEIEIKPTKNEEK